MRKFFHNISLYQKQVIKEKIKKLGIILCIVIALAAIVFLGLFIWDNIKDSRKDDNETTISSVQNEESVNSSSDTNSNFEIENNDTFDTANPIQINTKYTGNLKDSYDSEQDWYVFTLNSAGSVSFTLLMEKQNSDSSYWDASIRSFSDPDMDIIQEYVSGNFTDYQSNTVRLSAGTYYFEIESSNEYSEDDYSFIINYNEMKDSNIVRKYRGTYVAGQGITSLDFDITSCDEEYNMNATFEFYAHPDNSNVPSGSYTMSGKLVEFLSGSSMKISFQGVDWIEQPSGYSMLDFTAVLNTDNGRITSDDYEISLLSIENSNDNTIAYPKNASDFNGHKYCLYELPLSWIEAEEYCKNLGGHLVSINSQEEQEFVENLTSQSNLDNIWIGGYYSESDVTWKWSDSSGFSYTNWDTGQPDNHTGDEFYLRYVNRDIAYEYWNANKGGWNDTADNADGNSGDAPLSSFGFVCEWS